MRRWGEDSRAPERKRNDAARGRRACWNRFYVLIENREPEEFRISPAVKTIRQLAEALKVDSIELLTLADKLPKELEPLRTNQHARRFFDRAAKVASPGDWAAFLDCLRNGRRSGATKRRVKRRTSRWDWSGHFRQTDECDGAKGSCSLPISRRGTTQRILSDGKAFC